MNPEKTETENRPNFSIDLWIKFYIMEQLGLLVLGSFWQTHTATDFFC